MVQKQSGIMLARDRMGLARLKKFFSAALLVTCLWPKQHWQHNCTSAMAKQSQHSTKAVGWGREGATVYTPLTTRWHSAMKAQVEEEGRRLRLVFLFKGTVTHAEILFSRKCLDICLPLGSREFIYFYALLEHEAFVFPIKQSLSAIKQWVFLPSILSSSHGRGEWARCWVGIWLLAKVNQPQMPFTRIILWFVICYICFLTHFSHIL